MHRCWWLQTLGRCNCCYVHPDRKCEPVVLFIGKILSQMLNWCSKMFLQKYTWIFFTPDIWELLLILMCYVSVGQVLAMCEMRLILCVSVVFVRALAIQSSSIYILQVFACTFTGKSHIFKVYSFDKCFEKIQEMHKYHCTILSTPSPKKQNASWYLSHQGPCKHWDFLQVWCCRH